LKGYGEKPGKNSKIIMIILNYYIQLSSASYAGVATPSDIYQYKVGKILIEAPATAAKIAQYHPNRYWKLKKVQGTKALYTDVAVDELLMLPLSIGLSYKTNLTAQSGGAYARFLAVVTSHYQGNDIDTPFTIEIPLTTGWTRSTLDVTEVIGVARSYELWIDLYSVRGEFYFDNVRAYHTGTNWARDFRCNDVNNNLSRINYQIEKSWEEQLLPTGSAYDSVYYE